MKRIQRNQTAKTARIDLEISARSRNEASVMRRLRSAFGSRAGAEEFHPGDSIGFAYGLHHDTEHLHAHLALCPRTARGAYVGCSASRFSRSRHKKQMDLIKSWFERENRRWEKILQSPEETERAIRAD
jgi:hypothetical protein